MADVNIRDCTAADLPALEAWQPRGAHPQRWARHSAGESSFLLARHGGDLAGSAEIRWVGGSAPDPDCPELNGLQVWPADRQGSGIGTALIAYAEDRAAARGRTSIGLGVDDHNIDAARLYLRLGYVETGHRYLDRYSWVDENGDHHDVADPCRWLRKLISPA